jgi:hypothetical protein
LRQFAQWLSTTAPSVFIQNHNAWIIPAIQSIHIVGIAMALGAVFFIDLRVLGVVGTDQTLRETAKRFGPWLTGSLWLLLGTGVLMVIGEPRRELLTVSFWVKMSLVAIGASLAALFQASLRKREQEWERSLVHRGAIRLLAAATLLIWAAIIVLGRLIAYDHVWGSWSPAGA